MSSLHENVFILRVKYLLLAKMYLISIIKSSSQAKSSKEKLLNHIKNVKTFNNFFQRNSWKEMRTFWCRRKHTNMAKTLSFISSPTTFVWHIKIYSNAHDLWLSSKLYPPILCLTNIWLWFFFIISIRIRR